MRSHTCCFTGHRQLPPGKQAEIAGQLERVITGLYQRGILYYGAGGAWGVRLPRRSDDAPPAGELSRHKADPGAALPDADAELETGGHSGV